MLWPCLAHEGVLVIVPDIGKGFQSGAKLVVHNEYGVWLSQFTASIWCLWREYSKLGTAGTLCMAPVWESMKTEIQTHLTFTKLWKKGISFEYQHFYQN